MGNYEELLERIRRSPEEHLGAVRVRRIEAYFAGYDLGRLVWGLPKLPKRLSHERRMAWFASKFGLIQQNLASVCLLIAPSEGDAFDLFFEFEKIAIEECAADIQSPDDPTITNFDSSRAEKSDTFVNLVLGQIRSRPAMYLSSEKISSIWTMWKGFLWGERDLGITDSSDAVNFEMFQVWLDERFPFAQGQPWDKLFQFLSLGDEDRSLSEFYEHIEMFLNGHASDAPAKWVEEAIENIKKRSENDA